MFEICSLCYHQTRKDRAIADLRLQEELHKTQQLEALCKEQSEQIARFQQESANREAQLQQELQALRETLRQSQEREKQLRELNQEALALLPLFGINRMKSTD